MKTLLLLLLLVSGYAIAQPNIGTPNSSAKCDEHSNGKNNFNLNFIYIQTVTSFSDSLSFHYSEAESINNINKIQVSDYLNYENVTPYNETLYIRVTSPTEPNNPAFTSVNLIVFPLPIINSTPNLFQINIPNDGSAIFDFTNQSLLLLDGQSNIDVSYHPNVSDAYYNQNLIVNPSAYTNSTNPQTIGVRLYNNLTGCYNITSFEISVNSFPINNPTPLVVCDDDNDGFGVFDLATKDAEILGNLPTSEYIVSYHETNSDANFGINALVNPYTNTTLNNQTIYVRVSEVADNNNYSTTTLELIVNPSPIVGTIPALTVYENPFDGVANFDLTIPENIIINGAPNINVTYYTSQVDALTQNNAISNTTNFSGVHNQSIWVNVMNPSTGCFAVRSFLLKVVDSALVVYIPDNNFKTKLISANSNNTIAKNLSGNFTSVDTNSNGEIEFTEALNISYLDVNQSNIADMTGISSFTNLIHLDCRLNLVLNNLDVSSLSNLTYLNAYYAGLISLTLTPSIINLDISANSLSGDLDLTSFTNLQTFKSGPYNGLTSLNLSGLTNLITVDCSYNSLTSLNVDGCSQLQSLNCIANVISTFNGSGLVALDFFDCTSNQIPSLDVSSSTNLQTLNCGSNLISSLNVSSNSNLMFLDCNSNNITTLDVNSCPNLQTLYFYGNNITTIDLLNNPLLVILYAGNTTLTSLDLSNNSQLETADISSNTQLTFVSLKNGGIEENIYLSNNPNLQFVCADENEIISIQEQLNIALLENVVVNSYCSFTPGGDFNTITGTAIIDGNNNGCDNLDATMPYLGLNVSINGITTNSSVYTNGLGIYNLYSNFPGIYQLAANLENPTYFNVSPIEVDSNTIDNSTILQNICITPNGLHPDVEVVLAPINPARPGFDASYELVYKNKGNQTLSGTVTFNYNDAILDYVSATTAPTSQATGIINWNYSNLQPFENRSIGFVLNVNSPVETPAVNINDVLNFTTSISPISGDEIPSDNTFVFNQTVVGSYDPNDIKCLQGDTVSPTEIGNFLHYVINFENTGTYYAENVVVQDIIDINKYDISSLQILNASHTIQTRINGNKVEFIFQNINLEAVTGNPPVGGHGNVLFKIRSKNSLVTGDYVTKNASIFFDYNAPIVTNDAETTFVTLNNGGFNPDESLSVYPNPTNSILNITSDNTIESIELYDIQGRILEKSFQNSNAVILDISNRQNGIYFLKISSDKGSKVEKIVKK